MKGSTKVSIVVSDLSESGAGRWAAVRPFLLAQALKKIDCDVQIVGFHFGQDPSVLPQSEFPITAIPASNYPKFFNSISQFLSQLDSDIIYAVKLKPTSFGASLIHKFKAKKPLILDIDDWEISWYGGDRLQYQPTFQQFAKDLLKSDGALRQPDHPLYLKWIERFVPLADQVTTHTQFMQERFGGIYVPNGKNTALFDPNLYDPESVRQQYGLADFRILMFPGAPRPYKGLEDVLTALDRLNQPDLRLVIVGGSPYDDYDDRLIEKWGRWILKLPKLPIEKMPEIVSAAHIIVVPQQDNPAAKAQFPLKLTDGMSMAKPILATRVGDIPEIISDTGFLVDPSSPEQLAEKIEWIFQNLETANDRGKQARERCIKHYSIDAMAAILETAIAPLR